MQHRTIAGTDVTVSEVGFGVWTVATNWWGERTDGEALALLREARDLGVTYFDTADTYGDGRGETILAQAFPGSARAGVVIGTKFGYDWRNRPAQEQAGHVEAPQRWDPAFLEGALRESLQRLNTDYVDIWQLHNPRLVDLQRDDVWTFLEGILREGKVRAVGVALGPAIGWLDEGVYALRERGVPLLQMIYNALELDPGRDLIRTARDEGASLLVRVPHSSGMLEGRYTEDTVFPPSDHRSHRPRAWLTNGLRKVEQLSFLTEGGSTIGQAALRFVLHAPEVVSALPNIYDRDQLVEFAAAADCAGLTDEQVARVAKLYEENYGLPEEREHGLAQRPTGAAVQ